MFGEITGEVTGGDLREKITEVNHRGEINGRDKREDITVGDHRDRLPDGQITCFGAI